MYLVGCVWTYVRVVYLLVYVLARVYTYTYVGLHVYVCVI